MSRDQWTFNKEDEGRWTIFDEMARFVRIPVVYLIPLIGVLIFLVSLSKSVEGNTEHIKEVQIEQRKQEEVSERQTERLIRIETMVEWIVREEGGQPPDSVDVSQE